MAGPGHAPKTSLFLVVCALWPAFFPVLSQSEDVCSAAGEQDDGSCKEGVWPRVPHEPWTKVAKKSKYCGDEKLKKNEKKVKKFQAVPQDSELKDALRRNVSAAYLEWKRANSRSKEATQIAESLLDDLVADEWNRPRVRLLQEVLFEESLAHRLDGTKTAFLGPLLVEAAPDGYLTPSQRKLLWREHLLEPLYIKNGLGVMLRQPAKLLTDRVLTNLFGELPIHLLDFRDRCDQQMLDVANLSTWMGMTKKEKVRWKLKFEVFSLEEAMAKEESPTWTASTKVRRALHRYLRIYPNVTKRLFAYLDPSGEASAARPGPGEKLHEDPGEGQQEDEPDRTKKDEEAFDDEKEHDYPAYKYLEEYNIHWGYQGMIHRPLHWDGGMPIYTCMVDGARTWSVWPPEASYLFPPPLDHFECCNALGEELMYDWFDRNHKHYNGVLDMPDPLRITVHAGDCLLLPPFWIHGTEYLNRSLGVDFWPVVALQPKSKAQEEAFRDAQQDFVGAIFDSLMTRNHAS